jgi:hypothetical protein
MTNKTKSDSGSNEQIKCEGCLEFDSEHVIFPSPVSTLKRLKYTYLFFRAYMDTWLRLSSKEDRRLRVRYQVLTVEREYESLQQDYKALYPRRLLPTD